VERGERNKRGQNNIVVIQAKTKTWIQYVLSTKSDPIWDIEIGN